MGKVHGSLARAGKVKSSTPKVEKTPKKKAKVGRAKMRYLYNKRFANARPGARRTKPNSQAVQQAVKAFKEAQRKRIEESKAKRAKRQKQ